MISGRGPKKVCRRAAPGDIAIMVNAMMDPIRGANKSLNRVSVWWIFFVISNVPSAVKINKTCTVVNVSLKPPVKRAVEKLINVIRNACL